MRAYRLVLCTLKATYAVVKTCSCPAAVDTHLKAAYPAVADGQEPGVPRTFESHLFGGYMVYRFIFLATVLKATYAVVRSGSVGVLALQF